MRTHSKITVRKNNKKLWYQNHRFSLSIHYISSISSKSWFPMWFWSNIRGKVLSFWFFLVFVLDLGTFIYYVNTSKHILWTDSKSQIVKATIYLWIGVDLYMLCAIYMYIVKHFWYTYTVNKMFSSIFEFYTWIKIVV